jgi:hypothetical protein
MVRPASGDAMRSAMLAADGVEDRLRAGFKQESRYVLA